MNRVATVIFLLIRTALRGLQSSAMTSIAAVATIAVTLVLAGSFALLVGNMRGMKTGVDDGGIRSPLLFHWPAKVKARTSSDALCAHIDLLPTILDACDVDVPAGHRLDGRSFLSLLTDGSAEWPARQVVFQTHRGNVPQRYHHFAIHEDPWKLVHPSGFGKEDFEGESKLELFDVSKDPRQKN